MVLMLGTNVSSFTALAASPGGLTSVLDGKSRRVEARAQNTAVPIHAAHKGDYAMPFFLIWRGWGLLALLVPAVVCGLSVLIVSAVAVAAKMNQGGQNMALGITMLVTGLISAYLVWVWGRRLNSEPGRTLIDPADGSSVVIRRSHSLFWIPMQWWAPIIALFCLMIGAALAIPTPTN